ICTPNLPSPRQHRSTIQRFQAKKPCCSSTARKSIRPPCPAFKIARMRLNAPPISELRLQRYHRWMLLWLTWLAAFLAEVSAFAPLSRQATQIAHQWLDRAERLLIDIVLLRAAAH